MSQPDPESSNISSGSLDSFIVSRRPQPEPLATSQEVRERGSIFVASIYHATTLDEAKARVKHVKHTVHRAKPAAHEIAAWRCMILKHGRTGLNGPQDFELMQGSKDDGESWAGGRVLKVMQSLAIIDAVVIVSRWFGGTMLGPARFAHIETCAMEVCRDFKQSEELRECVTTLHTLDDLLGDLRAELATLTADSSDATPIGHSTDRGIKKPDYKNLDVSKAKRLVQARESSLKSVKALIAKKKETV
ncbi:ribosomal protein S5 domain 2-type protein [Crassisporium funariophilum]|nr:ribosomal protein S5 domain 2-type protein [Crassisporium funariophilum]